MTLAPASKETHEMNIAKKKAARIKKEADALRSMKPNVRRFDYLESLKGGR